jgi:hypothetical protein
MHSAAGAWRRLIQRQAFDLDRRLAGHKDSTMRSARRSALLQQCFMRPPRTTHQTRVGPFTPCIVVRPPRPAHPASPTLRQRLGPLHPPSGTRAKTHPRGLYGPPRGFPPPGTVQSTMRDGFPQPIGSRKPWTIRQNAGRTICAQFVRKRPIAHKTEEKSPRFQYGASNGSTGRQSSAVCAIQSPRRPARPAPGGGRQDSASRRRPAAPGPRRRR